MIPAMTKPQLASGPQKCTVFGPTGEFQIADRFDILNKISKIIINDLYIKLLNYLK